MIKRAYVLILHALLLFNSGANSQVIMSDGSVTVCSGVFMDPGGTGNYPNGATQVLTFYPLNTGDGICLDFTQWDLDYSIFGWSELSFFNGTSTAAPLIMTATGDWIVSGSSPTFDFNGPGMVCANGPLTVEWNPDDTSPGWEANISCYTPLGAAGCNISLSASASPICQGDSIELLAEGNVVSTPLSNDFNSGTIGTGWNSTVNARFDNPCGPGLDGTPHLWMGVEPSPRTLQSNAYDVSLGGTISFDFKMATQGNGSPCEGPDEADEGVYLQYSTSGGTTWNTIHYFYPPFYTDGSSHALAWQNYQFSIPPVAQTANTSFRWIQNEISSNSTDHWGIDNVAVSFPTATTISVDQGLGAGTAFTVAPTISTNYTATITDGIASCSASVTVDVISCSCDADVGTMSASTAGSTQNVGMATDQFVLCDGDSFVLNSNNDFINAPGGNPILDYAIYVCPPTAGLSPINDPCFTSSFIETPPNVNEINNGGVNANIINYLTGIGATVIDNTVWFVPITLSMSATNANEYDSTCYDLGNEYQVTYLNPITFMESANCSSGAVDVSIFGGYPEFFLGSYVVSNTGSGALSSNLISNHGGQLSITGLQNGDFYGFDVVDTNGCTVSFSGGPYTTPTIDTSEVVNPACINNDGSLIIQSSGITGTSSYSLNMGAAQSSNLFSGLSAGTYDVIVTDASGCSDTAMVLLSALDGILFDTITTHLQCNNDFTGAIEFDQVTGGDGNYFFSIDGGTTYQSDSLFTGVSAGAFPLSVIDGAGCVTTMSISITEPSALNLNLVTSAASCFGLCDGSAEAAVTGGVGSYSYSWSIPGVGNTWFNNTACAGIYSLEVTDDNNCTIDTSNFEITSPSELQFDSIAITAPLCAGMATGSIYLYSTDASTFSIDAGLTTQTSGDFTGLNAGVYPFVIGNSAGCEKDTSITINEPTIIDLILSNDTVLCPNSTISIGASVNGGTPTYSYNWNNSLPNQVSQIISPIMSTDYTVYVLDQYGCSSDTQTIQVTVLEPISVQAYSDTAICAGESVNINAVAVTSSGTANYNWSTTIGSFSSTAASTVTPTNTTVYTVIASDACPSNFDTANVIVTVNSLPNPDFMVLNPIICLGNQTSIINLTNPSEIGNLLWTVNGNSVGNQDTLAILGNSEGCLDVELIVTSPQGCIASYQLANAVCVASSPDAEFSSSSESASVLYSEVAFDNSSFGAVAYNWIFNQTETSTEIEPTYTFPAEIGFYDVCLIAISSDGCRDTSCSIIEITDELTLYVPNSFTPNADGVNDVFVPITKGFTTEDYEFSIYDRWGQLIHQTNSPNQGWDGTMAGTLVKSDVYIWRLRVRSNNKNYLQERTGHINCIY